MRSRLDRYRTLHSPERRDRITETLPLSAWVMMLLVERRQEWGWTQADVAEALGVSQSLVAHREALTQAPSLDFMAQYAELLGITVSTVIWRAEARRGAAGGGAPMWADGRRRG